MTERLPSVAAQSARQPGARARGDGPPPAPNGEVRVAAPVSWEAYLDSLEAALACLERGTWAELPLAGALGPLPEEARLRASGLLAELRSAEAGLRVQRAELGKRLEALRRVQSRRSALVI
jgi:hypothetical protein